MAVISNDLSSVPHPRKPGGRYFGIVWVGYAWWSTGLWGDDVETVSRALMDHWSASHHESLAVVDYQDFTTQDYTRPQLIRGLQLHRNGWGDASDLIGYVRSAGIVFEVAVSRGAVGRWGWSVVATDDEGSTVDQLSIWGTTTTRKACVARVQAWADAQRKAAAMLAPPEVMA